ncbi:hypothetical protein, partial [Enterococcus casseliflavus]|uniref:hypothetical protein n=1 Tax=Enterococcus casseliflavus TaxID=37734 RepID=UPI003D14D79A
VNVGSGDALDILASPESPQAEGLAIPAIAAIQLVQVMPSLAISTSGGNVTVSWPYGATGFVLESRTTLGPDVWTIVGAAPNPITGA